MQHFHHLNLLGAALRNNVQGATPVMKGLLSWDVNPGHETLE